ncbi:hypothetical protein D9758_000251 [Tetrapyrgos nigripes]|uniref:Polysaccharide lyase family 8 protein n=1 Tax=Tetrapyrgos nigripes TaxID=182062 RepID=A0A8H5H211_9AGAR|nr:hypothetical protein D9758_000251 [Tetrapyrgos nigripes]
MKANNPILLFTIFYFLLVAQTVSTSHAFPSLHRRHVFTESSQRPWSSRKDNDRRHSFRAEANGNATSDIQTIRNRRLDVILSSVTGASNVNTWSRSLDPEGKWPDIDYTTGCSAQRANWPAGQNHWSRLVTMAGAWHGNLPGAEQYAANADLASKISMAMNWWFIHDFTNNYCLSYGGTDRCPCNSDDFTLWNTNWFSNVIGVPSKVGQTCLLMDSALSSEQRRNCSHMSLRSYEGSFVDTLSIGPLTGANALDVASIGIDNALLNANMSLLTDAFRRVHAEVVVRNTIMADGVRADGSFAQHTGHLYNGNYGKDYTNAVIELELEAANTQFTASEASRRTMEVLFDGDAWMVFYNTVTGVLHWDFSVLGRFISFPVIDSHLGQIWSSQALTNFAISLSRSSTSANAGQLEGNRMFYANDYMPFGFHLADGTFYTYIQGNEYEDIAAVWDWNLIPGITVDYKATPLSCDRTGFKGIEKLVGGVSNGRIGIAAMQYTNPFTTTLSWKKAWFFLDDDIQHVMISNITSRSSVPVYSVLDQRRHTGQVFIDGIPRDGESIIAATGSSSLWHGGVGYTFHPNNTVLSLEIGPKTGNWSSIGISQQPPPTVDLFSAKLQHVDLKASTSYTAFPGTDYESFVLKSYGRQIRDIQNDGEISALYDENNSIAMAVFWNPNGGSVSFHTNPAEPLTLSVTGDVAVMYYLQTGTFTVANPSQSLSSVNVSVDSGINSRTIIVSLPLGGLAGSSVSV